MQDQACFKPYGKSPHKNLQNQQKHDLIIWHDVLNKSITSHRSNNNTPQSIDELLATWQRFQHHFKAIVYNRRIGTPDFFERLRIKNVLNFVEKKTVAFQSQKDNSD